ncbi:MAG: ABC transporter ATP-binding protein [Spirochaetales bacterium]
MITRKSTRDMPVFDEKQTADFDWSIFKRFLAYLKPHAKSLAVMYIFAILNVGAFLALPFVLQIGIDDHISVGDTEGLFRVALIMAGLLLVMFVAARTQGVMMMKIGYRVLKNIRRDLFDHLQYLSFRFFDKQKAGQIMSRLTNDVQVFEELLRAGLDTIVVDAFMLVGIAGAMIFLDARLSLVLLVTIPSFAVIVFVLRNHLVNAGRRIQRRLSSVNAFLNESISGIRVIRAFAREQENIGNFRAVNGEYYGETRRFYPLLAWFWQSVATLATLGPALVLLIGGILLSRGLVTIGVIAAFLTYINRFFQPMQKISNMLNQISRTMASGERIFEVLDVGQDVQDRPGARQDVELTGKVDFKEVWFAYDEQEWVARGLTFTAEPGETVAIVGPTGSGKTTIINLLCRFYEPQRGTIEVDGHDIRDLAQTAYRSQIALVMQDAHIFSGTVIENIRYGKPDATRAEVKQVARKMSIHEMIEAFPDGYDSEVGERGGKLSLGQKQLIAFARALVRDPRILILDEASSYLDSESERLVQEAMASLSAGRTSFVIAHRLATIQDADRIVVIEDGRIAEWGSHDELVARSGTYAKLLETQYDT